MLVRQSAGLVARRIVTDGKPGDRAQQGERLGMIRFGSRVDLFLPVTAGAAVRVAVGERVRAGATLLAEYGRGARGPHERATLSPPQHAARGDRRAEPGHALQ